MNGSQRSGSSRAYTSWLRAVAVVALAVLAFAAVWWKTVVHSPLLTVPSERLPASNGYDLYLRAGHYIVSDSEINMLTVRNRRAAGLIRGPSLVVRAQRVLAANDRAMQLLDTGMSLEYRMPRKQLTDNDSSLYRFGTLARLLAIRAAVLTARQDWVGAAMARLDLIAFTEGLVNGGGAGSAENASSYRRFAVSGTADPFERLTSSQLRAAIARLEGIAARRVPFADILVDDKWNQLLIRDELLSNRDWRSGLAGGMGGLGANRIMQLGGQARLFTLSKRQIMRDYVEFIDSCIAIARRPAMAVPIYPSPPQDPINSQLAYDIPAAHRDWMSVEQDDGLILLRMALRAYRLDHGAYPGSITSLCPTYLRSLPTDPFAGHKDFAYRRVNGSYLLSASAGSPPVPILPQPIDN